jgi:quinol monooxygenase YgiN
VFTIYERYVDAAAYDAHLESEPMRRLGFGDAVPRLESRERELLEAWEPAG